MVVRFGYRAVMTGGLVIVALSLFGLTRLQLETSGWAMIVAFFLFGFGMGNVIAPASTVMQNVLPLPRVGAGSAVQNTVRQVFGAFGVAVIGTVLATRYATAAADALAPLPAQARGTAATSVQLTQLVLHEGGGGRCTGVGHRPHPGGGVRRVPVRVALHLLDLDHRHHHRRAGGVLRAAPHRAAVVARRAAGTHRDAQGRGPAGGRGGRRGVGRSAHGRGGAPGRCRGTARRRRAGDVMTQAALTDGLGADGVVRRGRPRSIEADAAILDATLELIDETGLTGLSVESVAARAGVGKATIYRRWPSKEALVASALGRCAEEMPVVEPIGSLRDKLVAFVEQIRCKTPETHSGRIMPRMLSHASRSPELFRIYFDQVISPRRARVRQILRGRHAARRAARRHRPGPGRHDGQRADALPEPGAVRERCTRAGEHGGARRRGAQRPSPADSRQRFVIGSRRSRPNALQRDLRAGRVLAALELRGVDQPQHPLHERRVEPVGDQRGGALVALDVVVEHVVEQLRSRAASRCRAGPGAARRSAAW